ncbi:MAG: DMT family transporter [Hyphomicrobiaceae bacterium]|nr:DMT family transporter [Hyphomicrobiaceae bacterium]
MWRIWAAALFWGLNWPVIKVLLTGASPWTLRAAGLTGGAILLGAATFAARQSLCVPRRDWGKVVIAGLLNVAAFNILSVFAQMTMTASRAAILNYTMPLWSVLFARVALGERIDALRWVALGLGVVGISLLSEPFWATIAQGQVPDGLAYVLSAAIAWAAGTVYLKRAKPAGDPLGLTTWQFTVGAVATTIGMLLLEVPRLELDRPLILGAFIYNIIFPQAVAYALWFALMVRVPASTAALGTLLVPICAVAASSLWLGERLSPLDWLGFLVILGSVALDQGLRSIIMVPPAPKTPNGS